VPSPREQSFRRLELIATREGSREVVQRGGGVGEAAVLVRESSRGVVVSYEAEWQRQQVASSSSTATLSREEEE
jgi:hypothetical protein